MARRAGPDHPDKRTARGDRAPGSWPGRGAGEGIDRFRRGGGVGKRSFREWSASQGSGEGHGGARDLGLGLDGVVLGGQKLAVGVGDLQKAQ